MNASRLSITATSNLIKVTVYDHKTSSFLNLPTKHNLTPFTITTSQPATITRPHPNRSSKSTTFCSSQATNTTNSISGLCYVVGDNIDTDQIIPAIYGTLNPSDPEEYKQLGKYALHGLPSAYETRFVEPNEFKSKYQIIIAGDNFGCGSSREHAPKCMGAAGGIAVVAESYARIFFRNCVSTGELYPLESEVRLCDEFMTGDLAEIDIEEGVLVNCKSGKEYKLKAIGDAAPVIQAGGIFAYARKTGMISSQ